MFIKRNKIILAVFTLSIILLFSRVIYIQFILGEKLFIQATAQKYPNLPSMCQEETYLTEILFPYQQKKESGCGNTTALP